jgi:hypothetical protein
VCMSDIDSVNLPPPKMGLQLRRNLYFSLILFVAKSLHAINKEVAISAVSDVGEGLKTCSF